MVSLRYGGAGAPVCRNGVTVRDGYVVTSLSALGGATEIDVIQANAPALSASIVSSDTSGDIAVLNVLNLGRPSLTAAQLVGPTFGWSVFRSGCDAELDVFRMRLDDAGQAGVTIPLGALGSPLVDRTGSVMGLVSAGGRISPIDRVGELVDDAVAQLEAGGFPVVVVVAAVAAVGGLAGLLLGGGGGGGGPDDTGPNGPTTGTIVVTASLSIVVTAPSGGSSAALPAVDRVEVILTGLTPVQRTWLAGQSQTVSIANLLPGTYTVRLEAYVGSVLLWDGEVTVSVTAGQTASANITQNTVENPPTVAIEAPGQDTTVVSGDALTLTGTATDVEDGDLTSSIAWSSDIDGSLGSGGTVTPTLSDGVHAIMASVQDQAGLSASAEVTVTVTAVSPTLAITTMSLANGAPGVGYSDTLMATGGDGNYMWAVTSGALPTGLGLDATTGVISGSPTGTTSTFTVEVTSGDAQTDTQELTIVVASLLGRWVDGSGSPITSGMVGDQVRFQLCYTDPDVAAFQADVGGFGALATVAAQDDLDSTGGEVDPDCMGTIDELDDGYASNGSTDPISALIVSTATGPGTGPVGIFEFTFDLTNEGTLQIVVTSIVSSDFSGNSLLILEEISPLAVTGNRLVDADQSTVAVSQATMVADGVDVTTVTVTALDVLGNPVPGRAVVLAVTGTGNDITDPAAVTDANGMATGSFTTTTAEAKTVSAIAGGVSITETQLVTATPQLVDAGSSTVAVDQATMLADGVDVTTVTVTALDALGNPVPGRAVVLAVSGSGNTVADPVAVTDAFGVAMGSFTTTTAEDKTVSATAGGVLITQTQAVTANMAFTQLSLGRRHTCGLDFTGKAFCWGSNLRGQLGDGNVGSAFDRTSPTAVLGDHTFTQITAGGGHTCGLEGDAAYCWGWNDNGQIGDGTTLVDRPIPELVLDGHSFKQIDADDFQTCGVDGTGAAFCWGGNSSGQLGDGSKTDRARPTAVLGALTFAEVDAGGLHTCGLVGSVAYCWGENSNGELGNGGQPTDETSPVMVSGGLSLTQLAAGDHNVCALDEDGAAHCWGFNDVGQLGDGGTTTSSTPVTVMGSHVFGQIAQLERHTCGLEGSAAFCWGLNDEGQLGDVSTTNSSIPVAVSGGISFTDLAAGFAHTCGLDASGAALCWGWNDAGQLGDGSKTRSSTPVPVG